VISLLAKQHKKPILNGKLMMRNVNIECDEQQSGPINVNVLQALVNMKKWMQRAWDTAIYQIISDI